MKLKLFISLGISLYASYVTNKNGDPYWVLLLFSPFFANIGYYLMIQMSIKIIGDVSLQQKAYEKVAENIAKGVVWLIGFSFVWKMPFLLLTTWMLVGSQAYIILSKLSKRTD